MPKNPDDFAQVLRTSENFETLILDPTNEPIVPASLSLDLNKRFRLEVSSNQIDLHCPAGIVQSADLDTIRMLPFAVTVAQIPFL